MDNLISVFMNYKLNRLVEYGVTIFQQDSPFIRSVLSNYFQTYIDNYYYGVFNTIEDENIYNRKNLKTEFMGIMEEMLYDYQNFEGQVSNEEFQNNKKTIRELRDLSYEIVKIDTLEIPNREELPEFVHQFLLSNEVFQHYLEGKTEKMIRLIRETYTNENKILSYENQYYQIGERHFVERDDCVWYNLQHSIRSLDVYRKGLVGKVFEDERFDFLKTECLIQKISYQLLVNFLNHKENKKIFIDLPSSLVSRGSIDERILSLIDNPMFQRNVWLSVPYNTYLSNKNAFSDDYHFAFMQDFRHINDIYQKTEGIYNEGITHFLIMLDCKEDDRDFFQNYKNDVMSILIFEEE
ncbi:MAG: hypothetical protein J6X28_03525 [Bacilli bacterium]|nr:hypothetical protein [Bacilli bacterium]